MAGRPRLRAAVVAAGGEIEGVTLDKLEATLRQRSVVKINAEPSASAPLVTMPTLCRGACLFPQRP